MLRRSTTTGLTALGLLALGAAACSGGSGGPVAADKTVSGTNSVSAPTSAATGSATIAPTGSGNTGGITLVNAPAMSSQQSNKPLVVENNPLATLQDDFNPFVTTNTGHSLNAIGFFYEPLLMFDNLKAGTAYPWLAQSFSWNDDGTAITFTIRDNVKWSDGQPFTADDVAYTFQLMKDNKALNYVGLPISAVSTNGNQVTVTFTSPQFTNIYNIAGQTWIVPKHIYSKQSDLAHFQDKNPIGTGPYTVGKFSPQGIVLKANQSYWGGKPPAAVISLPAFASNDVALTQLEQGKIDYGGNNVADIEKNFVQKDPAHNHYFFPATNTVVLIPNVTKWPLSDKAVRLAISAGVNRQQLSAQGETGYEPAATSSSGLLLPNFESVLPSQYKDDLSPQPDANKVNQIMTAAGYAKDGSGIWAKDGKEVAFQVEDPVAYSDYYADARIISQGLGKLGFKVTVNGVTPDKWNADLSAGNFDTAIHWGSGGPSAYTQYDNWLDYGLVSGNSAAGDQGRWNDPATQAALKAYAGAATSDQQQAAVGQLAKIVSEQAPVIPLLYGAGWFEYSTKNYTGWPTKDNPYMDPSPNIANVEFVALHLKPAS